MPKDHSPREKAKRKRFDETRRAPRLTRQRAARNPNNSTDKCWFDVTMDNIKDVVDDALSQGKDIRIITAESAYCSICHSDLSKANIDAPNGLLGHCRRVKKCLGAKERRNIVTLGLKMRKAKTSSNAKGHPSFWDSVDSLRMMDEEDFPLKAYYLDRVMPEQPPLELESESPFRTSARTNHSNVDESSGHYAQTGESEIFDVEEDESDDDDEEGYEAIQLSPEAQGPSTYIFPPTCYDQQIPASAATRQQSVVNTPMGTVEPSPCITTSADLSPYSSGAVERDLFASQPYPQSYASPFLVPGSGGHALTATAVGSISYPPRSPPNAHHIQGTMHSHISSPATSTPGNTPARPITEGELYIPEVLIPNTTSSIRRANSNPPLTMTHSLPLPLHVSPPLNLPNEYAVLSDKNDGHSRSFFSNYRGSAGMTDPAALSGQGQPYNGHLQTGAEGYTYRNPPFNITIGGCMPTSDTPLEQQGHLHSVPLYPSLPPSPPLPVAPPIAIPSTQTLASHPLVSSLHHQSQGHAAPVVQAMHSLHQSPSKLYRAALGRQLAGINYPQSSLSCDYSMLAPSWDDNGGVVPNFRGLGMWMDAEQHRKSGAGSSGSAKNWAVPSARDFPGGFGLQALPKSNGIPTDTHVHQSSSAGPRTPFSLLAYSSSPTAATNRLPSHDALGLHSAHSEIHSQELWSPPMPLSTGFNDASSTLSPLEGTSHPQSSETAQALSYGYRPSHPFGSIAVPDSRDGVEVRGVAYLGAPRSLTRTEVGPQVMPRSQVPQTGANFDGVAYGAIDGVRSRHTDNYELVHGANSSSFQSSRMRSASFNTRQGPVEPHQQRYVHNRGGDLTWTIPPPDTSSIPTRGSGNENSIAATATSLEAQRLMTTWGGRAHLARRMQAGES